MQIAEVVILIANRNINKVYHYLIPPELESKVCLGKTVVVPFGNRKVKGIVSNILSESDRSDLKKITSLAKEQTYCTDDIFHLAKWMSTYYICSLATVLNAILPSFNYEVKEDDALKIELAADDFSVLEGKVKRAKKQQEVLSLLQKSSPQTIKALKAELKINRSIIEAMLKKNVIRIYDDQQEQKRKHEKIKSKKILLNAEQKKAHNTIFASILEEKFKVNLLYGVTGSGKTEVYLETIKKVITLAKQVIVLLPEIALTEQMLRRYKECFGDQVEIWHSNLNMTEKRTIWKKIIQKEIQILVGARSAVFAPFENLGLIIIDEEHESTYQQEHTPKYHAREVAFQRAKLTNSVIVLGSATPSLETAFETSQGNYSFLTLQKRYGNKSLPSVEIVDLRKELREGNFSIFSNNLKNSIKSSLAGDEQIILFLNRRGYHSSFVCRDCGHTLQCKSCSVALTYHATSKNLKCHYCNQAEKVPTKCPKCGSERIRGLGLGTEKVVEEVRKYFPEATVARIDVDTTRRPEERKKILHEFSCGKTDILVGTQIIAKGMDFPNVTLVGIINADLSLNIPDFRARERTFQLLTQVAGRAGRGIKKGKVIVQTYYPENEIILLAKKQDYYDFYWREIVQRKQHNFPPFVSLLRILVVGEDESKVMTLAKEFYSFLTTHKKSFFDIIGPVAAPISKINNKFRWHIILKSDNLSYIRVLVNDYLNEFHKENHKAGQVFWSVDINPQGIL